MNEQPIKQQTIVIPRLFHRIWLGDQLMPEEYKQFGEIWQTLHPNWEMILWMDDTLPPLKNTWAYNTSSSLAARSNIVRYEIVLRYGGIYVDTDFECLKNLEPLLEGVKCFVALQSDDFANNAIIGSVPGHPFLRDLVDSLEENVRLIPDEDPAVTQSGPYFLTKVLHRHPEVTIFPTHLFYPYEWHERWRRYEKFPEAYAVHHWSMTWRGTQWSKPKLLGNGTVPCLSVVVLNRDTGLRLEWIMEGLCVQTVSDFEVIVINRRDDLTIKDLVDRYESRLDIIYLYQESRDNQPGSAEARNLGLSMAQAERTLFLDGDCLPDPDLVETHANFGAAAFIPFGFRRMYPASKLYRFKQPVDYQGIQRHTFQDPRRIYPLFYGDWRDVAGFCFSAPTKVLHEVGGFDEHLQVGEDQDLARRLCQQKYRHIPLWNDGYVTYLGHPGDEELIKYSTQTGTIDEVPPYPRSYSST